MHSMVRGDGRQPQQEHDSCGNAVRNACGQTEPMLQYLPNKAARLEIDYFYPADTKIC